MQTVDEEPLETIHLYVVREEAKPPLFPIFLSVLALSMLLAFCVLSPSQQPKMRVTIRVPAVLLPLETFTAEASIIPTGIKVIPATTAQGILTITNGSVIAQTLPAGLIFTGNPGEPEVITDSPVFVPAGSASGYGYATVSAHAVVSGKSGNIPAYAIDHVIGSSIYVRNLTSFHGGKDSYTETLQLPQDRQKALLSARTFVEAQKAHRGGFLATACIEKVKQETTVIRLSESCQYVTYSVSLIIHIIHVRLDGKTVIVDGFIVVHPMPFRGK